MCCFQTLQKGYPTKFNELFIGNALEQFWEYALEKEDARIDKHPLLKVYPNWRQTTIPIFIHGDGVEFQEGINWWSGPGALCCAKLVLWKPICSYVQFQKVAHQKKHGHLWWSFWCGPFKHCWWVCTQLLTIWVGPWERVLRLTLWKGNNWHTKATSVWSGPYKVIMFFCPILWFTSLEFFASLLGVWLFEQSWNSLCKMGEEHQTLITRFYKGYTWASSGFTCQYTPFVQDSRCNNSYGS